MESFISKKGIVKEQEDPFAGLTPKERLNKKKELKAKEEAEKLTKFTKEAATNYQKATQRK